MENISNQQYRLTLTNRELCEATGIIEVDSFDEHQIVANSQLGPLVIKGEGLHIIQLNLEKGSLVLEGEVNSIQYAQGKRSRGKGIGLMERLFK